MVSRALTMEKTSDNLTKTNQKTELYNYNLDHVYCSDNSNYRNTTAHINLSATTSDLKALRKENKQLQAMLLLHLDLIQEQSNQLIAKDKQLLQLREENEELRLKCERNAMAVERRPNNNRYSGGDKGKSNISPTVDMYFTQTTHSSQNRSPGADKLKVKSNKSATTESILIDGNKSKNNIIQPKLTFTMKDESQDVSGDRQMNIMRNVFQGKDRPKIVAISRHSEKQNSDKSVAVKYRAVESSIIGNKNGKLISKIILQRKKSENGDKIFARTKSFEVSNANTHTEDKWDAVTIKTEREDDSSGNLPPMYSPSPAIEAELKSTDLSIIDTSMDAPLTSVSNSVSTTKSDETPPRESMSSPELQDIKVEHDTDDQQCPDSEYNDESNDEELSKLDHDISSATLSPTNFNRSPIRKTSMDSSLTHQPLSSACTLLGATGNHKNETSSRQSSTTAIMCPSSKRHIARHAFLMTKKPYKTREWQLDEIEFETKQQITDEPCKTDDEVDLELPKWRTWELNSNRDVSVARENEDLSDEAFSRRHARFLLDERKRKKWDVQRIREQRTIERLKRRHCKDELNQQTTGNEIVSFFPSIDQLKTIQITDDLPVSAFGEMIPLIPAVEFALPWHTNEDTEECIKSLDCAQISHQPTTLPTFNFSQIKPNNSSNSGINSMDSSSNVSAIVFLAKKRASRTKTNNLHLIHHIRTST